MKNIWDKMNDSQVNGNIPYDYGDMYYSPNMKTSQERFGEQPKLPANISRCTNVPRADNAGAEELGTMELTP